MTDELNRETGEQVEDMTTDYLAAIKELKQNSVDRSQYEALKAENKKLLNSVINGQTVEVEQAKPQVDIQKLREELFTPENGMNNITYVSKALELRDALIAKGEPDPFLPWGKQISPTRDDIDVANKVAQVYAECIEYAQGDSEAFTNELMRRTRDVRIR